MRFVRLRYFISAAIIGVAVWMWLKPGNWENWMGFSHYAYFTGGNSGMTYALYSGILPCLLTAIGLGTIISGLFHKLNCHVAGCPRIGRFPLAGGQFTVCHKHHPDEEVQQRRVSHGHILRRHQEHLDRTVR